MLKAKSTLFVIVILSVSIVSCRPAVEPGLMIIQPSPTVKPVPTATQPPPTATPVPFPPIVDSPSIEPREPGSRKTPEVVEDLRAQCDGKGCQHPALRQLGCQNIVGSFANRFATDDSPIYVMACRQANDDSWGASNYTPIIVDVTTGNVELIDSHEDLYKRYPSPQVAVAAALARTSKLNYKDNFDYVKRDYEADPNLVEIYVHQLETSYVRLVAGSEHTYEMLFYTESGSCTPFDYYAHRLTVSGGRAMSTGAEKVYTHHTGICY